MPKVSIIVPVYKAEAYLHRCVDSILNQTFEDFELILIDDGSPERSGEICDEYAKKDSRIKTAHLLRNGGVSRARNKGLELSHGEWITFVDADDYVREDFLQQLLGKSEGVDFVVGGYSKFDADFYDGFTFEESRRLTGEMLRSFYREQLDLHIMKTPWGKLFARKLIEDNTLRFDISLSLGEDAKFVLNYLRWVRSLQIVPSRGYCYNFPSTGNVLFHRKFHLEVNSIAHFYEEMRQAYQQLSQKYSIKCIGLERFIQNFSLGLFVSYQMDAVRRYKLNGYQDYRRFVHVYWKTGYCLNGGGNSFYCLINYLSNNRLYGVMFFGLRFIFPLILNVKRFLREHRFSQ